ncbi:MAG: SUF system Fe-S cluster assembly regulator [Gammaproteobacteria bacterium]|nr:SUF system Fe-S cluster assembly regulator [Gammaproteobacteria bacterium]
MLRISKLTDYALLIMGHMSIAPVATLSASQIAQALNLNAPTVSKILKMLAEGDIVLSVRGSIGGYHLARPPGEITVAQVITIMEGRLIKSECSQHHDCTLHSVCLMRENWQKINGLVQALLHRFTLLDLLKPLSMSGLIDVK